MEQIKQKKKSKWKYFVFPLLAVILIFSIISGVSYINYKSQITAQSEEKIIQEAVNKGEISAQNLKGLVNPRLKIRNSTSYEVIGLDHEGTITAIGNISLNWTIANNNAGYGFFKFLGDSLTPILKGWFVQLNTTNITSTRWCNSTACFSTEQFTIDTDTDTFNTTIQTQTAINNTGFYNITINQSYGLNTTQYGCTGLLCSIKETFLGIWGDTKYLLLGTKLGNTTAEMDAIDDVGQNDTWGGNASRVEGNIQNNATILATWVANYTQSGAYANWSQIANGSLAFMDYNNYNVGNLSGNGSASNSWLRNWTGLIGRNGNMVFRLGTPNQNFLFQDYLGNTLFGISSLNPTIYSALLPSVSNTHDIGAEDNIMYGGFFNFLKANDWSNVSGSHINNNLNWINASSVRNDTWMGNQTRIENNIIANGSQQWHNQDLNTTSNVSFDNLNVTRTIYHPFNEKNCWGNASHPCWVWSLGNATGYYAWGGG